jgi:hypothetical protein
MLQVSPLSPDRVCAIFESGTRTHFLLTILSRMDFEDSGSCPFARVDFEEQMLWMESVLTHKEYDGEPIIMRAMTYEERFSPVK